MKIRMVKLILCQALLTSSFYCAAEINADNLMAMSLDELMKIKVETATRTQTTLDITPAAVSVFSYQDINIMGVQYLHELLALVPGYQVARGMDYSFQYSVSSRGVKSGSASREILYLIDGIPLNSPRSGNESVVAMYPLSQIERVEIIRGPGASLYGANAFAGVVNIISRKQVSEVTLSLGNDSYQRVSAMVNHAWGDWQVDFSFHYDEDKGQSYRVPDTFSDEMLTTKDPIENLLISARLYTSQSELKFVKRKISSTDFYNVGRLSEDYNYNDHTLNFVAAKHNFTWWEDIRSSVSVSYLQFKEISGNQSTPEGAFFDISEPQSNEPLYGYGEFVSSRWLAEWQSNLMLTNDSSMQFGIELRETQLNKAHGHTNYDLLDISQGNVPITFYGNLDNFLVIGNESSQYSQGYYLQYQKNWLSKWQATIGLRYDVYSQFPEKLSPRLGVVYSHSDNNHIKLLYGEAYRVPSFAESNLINTVNVLGNPNLVHESVKTLDLIWWKKWQKGQLNLGFFHNRFEDPIANITRNNIRTYENVESDESYGVEVEGQWQVNKRLLFKVSGTHFFELPDAAFRESSDLMSIQANYQKEKLNINFSLIYNGDREMLDTDNQLIDLDSYWLLNGKITYQLSDRWRTYALMQNVLDQAYETPPISNTLESGIPNRGVSWQIGVEFSFN